MQEYINAMQAAQLWKVTPRWVQRLCADGLVPGAVRLGRAWMIPADALRPEVRGGQSERRYEFLMSPLLHENSAAAQDGPGACNRSEWNLAMSEHMYIMGNAAQALEYLANVTDEQHQPGRLVLCACANASLGNVEAFMDARDGLDKLAAQAGKEDKPLMELACMAVAVSAYDNSICPKWLEQGRLELLPPYARNYGAYVLVKHLFTTHQFETLRMLANSMLTLLDEGNDAASVIYIRIQCAAACNALGDEAQAQRLLLEAMAYALPRGWIAPFAENLTLLSDTMTNCLERFYPEYKDAVVNYWKKIWHNWLKTSAYLMRRQVTLALTLREYQIATLAVYGSSNAEIARSMHLSVSTVKATLKQVYEKLYISSRSELQNFIF